jgi:DNA mismatch repair ATPase MutS
MLGRADKGIDYRLHHTPEYKWGLRAWWHELVGPKGPVYSFELHPRDEAGFRALGELKNRGISVAANALSQSADHVRDFFAALRIELAFYLGCVNLAEFFEKKGEPTCFPTPHEVEDESFLVSDLYDVGLAITLKNKVVGNDANADGKSLVVITGPNTGGKSTFLRSAGLAQMMMQAGMFVGARRYDASVCHGLHTHYKREEDTGMVSGKFDEEVARMSEIVDHIQPYAMLLSNESFSSTNEREGSEIGRMIFSTLLAQKVRVLCVTHMYALAQAFYADRKNALFLRAARAEDGTRSFKLAEGEPLPTSFGDDLYKRIFVAA